MPFTRFFGVVKVLIFLILFFIFSILTSKNVSAGTETISFSSSSSVTTASGFVGDTTNTVFLSGGAKRTTFTFYWASTGTGTTVNLGTCATSGSGTTCSLNITIPHSSKGNWIIHDNSSGGNGANTLTFTVNTKISSVSPTSGNRNTTVTVSGTGFAAETVSVYFGIPTTYLLGSGTVTSGTGGTNGDLSVSAAAPSMPFNNYTIYATGTINGTITSTQAFNMQPSVSLSASSGPWGTTITISGWGFATSSAITIRQDGTDTATTGTADTNGAFTGISYTPTGTAGTHSISARDASSHISGTQNFSISPVITLSSNSGNAGATTNVSGNGFAASSTITIQQDGSNTTTTGTSNSSGSFTNIVYTPTGSAGLHTINATDGTNTASALNYTITASGTLSLSIPGSTTLGNVTLSYPNPSGTGSLGTVQVDDSRGTNVGWSCTATTTNYWDVNQAVLVSGANNTVTSGGTYDFPTGGTYTLTITTKGSVGHSVFSVSGLESASGLTTGSNVAIGTRGVTATFGTATYQVGDSWTITVYTIPIDSNTYFTINPNNSTLTVVSGSGTGVTAGTSHGFTSNTDAATIITASSGNGNGTYTINPSLSLTVPIGTFSGNYSATITETLQ